MPTYFEVGDRRIPEPRYVKDVEVLVLRYQKAMLQVLRELERLDVTEYQRAQSRAVMREIEKILTELDLFAEEWIKENIPETAREGTALALWMSGATESYDDALNVAKFNKITREIVDLAIEDTFEDLLAVTTNVKRKVRNTVREVLSETMRTNLSKNVNGSPTLKREALKELREKLGASVETGIIDASGRRWKPDFYVDTAIRTKMSEIHRQATTNQAIDEGMEYGMISSHGAKDACKYHEGRIIKMSDQARGNYPSYAYLRGTGQVFHPRCKHFIIPVYIDDLPQSVREKADKQAEIGAQATATGKRDPKI